MLTIIKLKYKDEKNCAMIENTEVFHIRQSKLYLFEILLVSSRGGIAIANQTTTLCSESIFESMGN